MATELWYPIPRYRSKLEEVGLKTTVSGLCEANGIPCKMEGPGAKRAVFIVKSDTPFIDCTPHQQEVCIGTRHAVKTKAAKKYALAAMAYAVFDLAARESVRGLKDFYEIKLIGRPRTGRVLSNAERQRKFRQKRN